MLQYSDYQVSKQTGEIEELRQEVKNRDEECLFKDVEMLNRRGRTGAGGGS
jgi:chorismate mutase